MRIYLHRILLLLLGSALSLSASAQVFKCVDSTGKTAYQSQPCPEATRSAQIDVRSVSALPALPANGSVSEIRQTLVASCMAQGARSTPALARIAAEQPRKFRDFCDCTADTTLTQVDRVKELATRGDRAGMERLGIQVGLACASRLQ
ncbi:hypothetical protein J2X20_002744 [Pelomonas saccharophila]|uniref:DUF4124 domain-containing protein n=1 Tax=Roseateles saccharophilus TaxID=304 RepID=A0ABU1YQ68_ROSSA|nr:DUF4124 domain-containing protein [Roseateles saccharophilus]MDR7270086.1 hypothetical protein [Roseateles saccharophilus]